MALVNSKVYQLFPRARARPPAIFAFPSRCAFWSPHCATPSPKNKKPTPPFPEPKPPLHHFSCAKMAPDAHHPRTYRRPNSARPTQPLRRIISRAQVLLGPFLHSPFPLPPSSVPFFRNEPKFECHASCHTTPHPVPAKQGTCPKTASTRTQDSSPLLPRRQVPQFPRQRTLELLHPRRRFGERQAEPHVA